MEELYCGFRWYFKSGNYIHERSQGLITFVIKYVCTMFYCSTAFKVNPQVTEFLDGLDFFISNVEGDISYKFSTAIEDHGFTFFNTYCKKINLRVKVGFVKAAL